MLPIFLCCAFRICFMSATCCIPLSLLRLIAPILSDNEYNLWSSSLCTFLQPPVTSSSHFQIFSWAPCSETSMLSVLPFVKGLNFTWTKCYSYCSYILAFKL
jgi:hypothetical protein